MITNAKKLQPMFIHLETRFSFYPLDVLCDVFITLNHQHPAADPAEDQVFMTFHSRPDPVAAIRLVDLLDQSQVIQGFQRSVDAGDSRRIIKLHRALIDLLGR